MMPPHNTEAEQAVLAAMMLDHQCALTAKKLNKDDFYHKAHGEILEAIQQLLEQDIAVDMLTVIEQLTKTQKIDKVGGGSYIAQLADSLPTVANFNYYLSILKENAYRRKLIVKGNELLKAAYQRTMDDVNAQLHNITQIALDDTKNEYWLVKDLLIETHLDIEKRTLNKDKKIGVQMGFVDIDNMITGMEPGDNIVVAARPSMGKTAFALNIANYVAYKYRDKGPCVFFSLEMEGIQLLHRLIAMNARINLHNIRAGILEPGDWDKITKAAKHISVYNLIVDDTPGLTTYDIEQKLTQIVAKHGRPTLVLIDYLQFILPPRKGMTEFEMVTSNSRAIKNIAKKFNVPVILLSQLSRGVEARQNKRPQLSDLRQSGAIEQDADVVMFLYRDEYYNKSSDKKGIAEVIIAKQRNGPTGTVELVWFGEFQLFASKAKGVIS